MQNTWTRGPAVSSRISTLVALAILGIAAAILVASGLLSAWLGPAGGSSPASRQALPSTASLAADGGQASQFARTTVADAVLRQVDVDPSNGRLTFRFVGATTLQEVDVIVPSPTAPSNQWEVRQPPPSPLTHEARPGMDVSVLRVAPDQAVRAMTAHWPGCVPGSLTLAGEREALTWYAFCDLTDGRVASGTVDGQTGAFQPSAAPPAAPAATAAPSH